MWSGKVSRHLSLIAPSSVSFSTRDGWTFGGPQLFSFSLSSPSSYYSSIMQVNWINESRQTGLFAAFRQNFSWLSSTQSEQHDILSEPYIYVIVIFVCCILWVSGQLTSHILFDCGSRGSIETDVQVYRSAMHQNFSRSATIQVWVTRYQMKMKMLYELYKEELIASLSVLASWMCFKHSSIPVGQNELVCHNCDEHV